MGECGGVGDGQVYCGRGAGRSATKRLRLPRRRLPSYQITLPEQRPKLLLSFRSSVSPPHTVGSLAPHRIDDIVSMIQPTPKRSLLLSLSPSPSRHIYQLPTPYPTTIMSRPYLCSNLKPTRSQLFRRRVSPSTPEKTPANYQPKPLFTESRVK